MKPSVFDMYMLFESYRATTAMVATPKPKKTVLVELHHATRCLESVKVSVSRSKS